MKSTDSDQNCNSDDPPPDGLTVKLKARPSSKMDRVALEKCEPEGLPAGWTKEIKVTKKGRKIRRDPYYTDPVSGYVFRSMKDVLRYLETGDLGKLAFRPKDKSSNILGSEDDEVCLPAAAKKQKLEVNRTCTLNTSNQSSKLSKVANYKHVDGGASTEEVANDKHVLSPAGTRESMPVYEHISGEEGSQSKNSGVLENRTLKQNVQPSDPDKSEIVTTCDNTLDSETIKDESERKFLGKSKKKKDQDLSLPRRTSKRLSGLPLDPTPELKTTNRAKRSLVSRTSKHPIVKLAAVAKVETENMDNEKPESLNISPSRDQLEKESVKEDAGKIQIDNNGVEESGLYPDLPLGEFCQDPCIAFAIKTLTGISLDGADTVQVSTGSNSDFGGSLATSEDRTRRGDAQNGLHIQQGYPPDQARNNELHVEETEVSNKDNLCFAWADPCIEFAIKTLTGAIPLDYSSQHKASSSSSGASLQNTAEIYCQKFSIPGRHAYNQGALMDPGLRHDKNMKAGYSNGTLHAGNSEDRCRGIGR